MTNICIVHGILSRDPEYRELRRGDTAIELDVTVAAHDGRPTESIPVVFFSPIIDVSKAGEECIVIGRVRRRFFRALGGTQARTEVVADRVLPMRTPLHRSAAFDAITAATIRVSNVVRS